MRWRNTQHCCKEHLIHRKRSPFSSRWRLGHMQKNYLGYRHRRTLTAGMPLCNYRRKRVPTEGVAYCVQQIRVYICRNPLVQFYFISLIQERYQGFPLRGSCHRRWLMRWRNTQHCCKEHLIHRKRSPFSSRRRLIKSASRVDVISTLLFCCLNRLIHRSLCPVYFFFSSSPRI